MKIKRPQLSKAEKHPALMAAAVDQAEDAVKRRTPPFDVLESVAYFLSP